MLVKSININYLQTVLCRWIWHFTVTNWNSLTSMRRGAQLQSGLKSVCHLLKNYKTPFYLTDGDVCLAGLLNIQQLSFVMKPLNSKYTHKNARVLLKCGGWVEESEGWSGSVVWWSAAADACVSVGRQQQGEQTAAGWADRLGWVTTFSILRSLQISHFSNVNF